MFDDILKLILALLPIIKPSELDRIKVKIRELEEQHAKEQQEALEALAAGDIATLNRIIARLLEMQDT